MAAQLRRVNRSLGQMQKNLECSICLDLLQDPVSTKCDHQFCSFCIHALLDKRRKPTAPCPLCKEPINKRSLTSNDRLNEIVNAVRCVVKAVEEDTGFRCTPPRGPRSLSQETPLSVAKSKGTTIRTSPKISKTKPRPNLRTARAKASSTGVSIYIDCEESDGSESSDQGPVLIADLDSIKLEGKVQKDSKRKAHSRRPLQPTNHEQPIRETRFHGISSFPENDRTARPQESPAWDVTHSNSVPDAKLELDTGSNKLLQVLEESSLGVFVTIEEGKREMPKIRKNLRRTAHRQDDSVTQGLDDESAHHCTVKRKEHRAGEFDENSRMLDVDISKPLARSGEDVGSTSGNFTGVKSGDERPFQKPNFGADLEIVNCHEKDNKSCKQVLSKDCECIQSKAKPLPSRENDSDDPYEFVASQRTPRKLKPKRRQKNPSGKASKEFDYMKWKKGGCNQKKLSSGSQAVFSQLSTESQVLHVSPSSGDEQQFKELTKKTEKVPADVEQLSQTECLSSNIDKTSTSHQTASQAGQTITAAITQQQGSEEKCVTDKRNVIKLPDETSAKPNAKAKQQRCSQEQKKTSEEGWEPQEEHVSRRLRSQSKALNSRCERNEDSQKMAHKDDFGMASKHEKTPDKNSSDDCCEKRTSRKENGTTAGKEARYAKICSDEDGGYCDNSEKRSTPDSLTDPSYDPSTGSPKLISLLFQEPDTERKLSHRTELCFTSALQHSRHPARETAFIEEEPLEMTQSSQPIVKKRSPLASTGVFGQVYKRGSFRQKKTSVEDNPSKNMGIDEKVKKMYSLEKDSENIEAFSQDKYIDLQNSGESERSSCSPASISQIVDSQKDLFDKDKVENIDFVDLTTESDSEGISVESEQPLEICTVQNLAPHSDHERERSHPEILPPIEKHQQNEAATGSDWEFALALAREFDTAPRQFSLRSSRRGGLDHQPNGDFGHLSRTKPLLDVTLERKRIPSKASDTAEVKTGDDAKTLSQEQWNHCDSKTNKDHTITAGRKKLCHKQELVNKDVENPACTGKKTRRRSSRRLSNLPSGHEIDGVIESYDSNTDCQIKPTNNQSERSKQPNPSEVVEPAINSDLGPPTSNRKMHEKYQDHTQSHVKEVVQESKCTRSSRPKQPPNLPNISTETKQNHCSGRITRQQEMKANKTPESAIKSKLTKKASDAHPSQIVSSCRATRSKRSVSPKDPDTCNKKTRSANSLSSPSSVSPDEDQTKDPSHKTSKTVGPSPQNYQEAEKHEDIIPECIQSGNAKKTKRFSPRAEDGCRESGGSDTGDTTESIDLGIMEYEEEKIGVQSNTTDTFTHLSGSNGTSSRPHGNTEDIKLIPLFPKSEPKLGKETGPKIGKTTGIQNALQNSREGGKSPQVESTNPCSQENPDSIDEGEDLKKELERSKNEIMEKESLTAVNKPLAKTINSWKAFSNQDLQQGESSKSWKDTVPETILSEATEECSSRTGSSHEETVKGSRKARKLRSTRSSADKTPSVTSTVLIETSSNQESEKLLVQPPEHYHKTFVEENKTCSSSASQESTQEKCLSLKVQEHKATQKRKSCPEDRNLAEMKPNKRHRSADVDVSQIQQWGMGSRQRSTRLGRTKSSAGRDIDSSDAQKDSHSVLSPADHAEGASGSICGVMESPNSLGSSIPTQHKSRSHLECHNSKAKKSLPESEDVAVKRVNSVSRPLRTVPSHNDMHSDLESCKNGSSWTGLGSCSLFKDEESTKQQRLSNSQDVQQPLHKANSQVSSATSSLNISNSIKSESSQMENYSTNQDKPKDVECNPEDDGTKSGFRGSDLELCQGRQSEKSGSSQSLFSDITSECTKQESSAPSTKLSTSADAPKTSLSIPYRGMPGRFKKSREASIGKPSATTTMEEVIPASEGASLNQDFGPIPIPQKHRKNGKKYISSSSQEHSDVSVPPEEESLQKKKFSFRRKSPRFQNLNINLSSSKELNTNVIVDINNKALKQLPSSPLKTASVARLKPPKSEMPNLNSCVSNRHENAPSSTSSSPQSSSSKPQKRQRSLSASRNPSQSEGSETSPDEVARQKMELRKRDHIVSRASCNGALGEDLKINGQHSLGDQPFMNSNEEKMRLPLDVEKDINDKSHREADLHSDADSGSDVEMVSAEEPCQVDFTDGKDVEVLDVRDSGDENDMEDFDEISNNVTDDYDDDDDIIIPPTPPCQSTTNFQIQKPLAYVIHSTSATPTSSTIQSSKNPKYPKQNLEASHSSTLCTKTEASHADEFPRQGQKAHQNLVGKPAPPGNHGFENSKTKDSERNITHCQNSEKDDDEVLESSLKRVFPLSSSPLRNEDDGDKELNTRNVTCKDDASENSQSLSIFQIVSGKKHERGDTVNRNRTRKRSSQPTESLKEDEKAPCLKSKMNEELSTDLKGKNSVRDGTNHQNRNGTKEDEVHLRNNLVELEGGTKAEDKAATERGKDKSSMSGAEEGVEDGNVPIAFEQNYDTEGSTCSESSCSHHLNLTSASSVLSSQGEIMNTQQRINAKETLKMMAQEIAQIEAALADDTDTVTHQQDLDTAHIRHPENHIKATRKNNESHQKEINGVSRSNLDKDCEEVRDYSSQDGLCPPSVDICTPGDLFTPSEVYSNNPDDHLEIAPSDDDTMDSHHGTPESSDSHDSEKSRSSHGPSVLGLKRSRAHILEEDSESDVEVGIRSAKAIKAGHDVQLPDENPVDTAPSKRQLEIPGVTTFGSDSEMSDEDLPISSESPQSPSLPAPRSPSPPPELSQSTVKRVSSFKSLPEGIKAISRLAKKIKSQSTGSFSSPGKVTKSKVQNTTPGLEIQSDSDSSDEEVVCRTPRNTRPSSRKLRAASENTKTQRKGSSGWKSKALEMLSSTRSKTQTRSPPQTPKSARNTTPLGKNDVPCEAASNSGQPANHSTRRAVQTRQSGRKSELQKGSSKLGENEARKGDQSEDEIMDERSPSPVIGRSCLTTPGPKKQKAKSLSFVTTGLVRSDMRDVEQLTKRFGCRFASTFNACTTHVIVNTDDHLVCERTLKYFQGIAARVWVVSFKWVSACLKTDELLPEEPFEVQGDVVNGSSHNGPRRARHSKGPYPLHKYDICCVGPFTGLNKEQLVSLLEMMGASTVQHPSVFPYTPDRKAIIVAQAEAGDSVAQYNALYKKFRVPVISREWILDVIATYKIQPMTDYLLSDSGNTLPIIDLDSDDN